MLRAGSQRFAVGTIPKPLATIVSEYLQLTYKETQRTLLQRNNPLAQSMYSLLDYAAGGAAMGTGSVNNNSTVLPSNNGYMFHQQQQQHQQQYQGQMMYPPPQQPVLLPDNGVVGGVGGGIHMVSMGGIGNNQQQMQQRQPPLTPGGRHAQRKGAPKKRRRLDNDFETMLPYGGVNEPLPFDPSIIVPLNNGEYSLFDNFSFDPHMMQICERFADKINKTQQEIQGVGKNNVTRLFNGGCISWIP